MISGKRDESVATKIGKRVIVIGSSGSGKSTLGERLAERMDVPFIELDALHWEANWTPADRDVFRERVQSAIEPESWVLAGNYISHQQDVSWSAADTVIWLDLPLSTVMPRIIRRCWQRHTTQESLWGTENTERFWDHLKLWNTDESLISYTIMTHPRRKREFAAEMNDPRWSHLNFVRISSPATLDRLTNQIETDLAASRRGRELRDGSPAIR